jgi:hypothetical protein
MSDYKCTDCGGDAYCGATNWKDAEGNQLIREDERLCIRCAKKRVPEFFDNPFSPKATGGTNAD